MFTDFMYNFSQLQYTSLQALLSFGGYVLGAVVVFFLCMYFSEFFEKYKRSSHFIIKGLLASLGPVLSDIFILIRRPIPEWINIVFIAVFAIILLSNVLIVGPIKGVASTILNHSVGFMLSIAFYLSGKNGVLLFFGIILVGSLIFGGSGSAPRTPAPQTSSVHNGSQKSESAPEYLTNVSTNESYYVTTNISGDTLFINDKIVRKVDSNRYIDDYGNTYISYDD